MMFLTRHSADDIDAGPNLLHSCLDSRGSFRWKIPKPLKS